MLARLGIDPRPRGGGGCPPRGRPPPPADKPWARVEVRSSTEDRDPALLVDVEMSGLSVPELALVQMTNPRASRSGIGRALEGRDTLCATRTSCPAGAPRPLRAGSRSPSTGPTLRLLPRV